MPLSLATLRRSYMGRIISKIGWCNEHRTKPNVAVKAKHWGPSKLYLLPMTDNDLLSVTASGLLSSPVTLGNTTYFMRGGNKINKSF